jgi:hypothetical protein
MPNKGYRKRSPEEVLAEIQRRAREWRPISAKAVRGDWLYPTAIKYFKLWSVAIEAAGLDYDSVKVHRVTKEDVLAEIRRMLACGDDLKSHRHVLLASRAARFFGTWRAAIEEAGGAALLPPRYPTAAAVVAQIRRDRASGLPLNTTAVLARNDKLYSAARRRLGSWVAALVAADAAPPTLEGVPPRKNAAPRPC